MNLATAKGTVRQAGAGDASADRMPLVLVVLLLLGAMLLTYGPLALAGLFPDTDDTMRMVMVRDLLGGQGWFDATVGRLSPPGVEMHWSRLVDLPLAGLVGGLSILIDGSLAERIAAIVWPLALLVAALFVVHRLAARLVGPDGTLLALGMIAASFCVWNYFPPGRVDHHNVQLVLGLTFVVMLVRVAEGEDGALPAGAVAALMAAIGMESLPWILAGTAWLAVMWVRRGGEYAGSIGAFGLALGLAMLLLLVATRGPDILVEQCDSLSIVHVTVAAFGGAALGMLGLLIRGSWRLRLAALVAAGAAVAGYGYSVFPQCAAGPYAELPADLVARWLVGVGEARSFAQILATDPGMVSQYTVAALGLGAAIWLALKEPRRGAAWSLLAAAIAVSLAVGFLQVRVAVSATVLAALPLAALFHRLKAGRGAVGGVLVFLGGLFAGSTMAQAMAIEAVIGGQGAAEARAAVRPCWTPTAIRAAADLPPGLVLAPIDLGPPVLYFTPHSVLGAPYHRNAAGNLAVLRIYDGTPAAAARTLRAREIGYVFYCSGQAVYGAVSEGSLRATLEAGEPPAWLVPVPADPEAGLAIYRVAPVDRAGAEASFLEFDLRGVD